MHGTAQPADGTLAYQSVKLTKRDCARQSRPLGRVERLTNDESIRSKLLETLKKTYSLLPAFQKIPSGKLQEFGRKDLLNDKPAPLTNYHQSLADELLFLKLYDEGTPELETALREKLTKNTN